MLVRSPLFSGETIVWKKDLPLLYPEMSYHVAIDLYYLATYCGTDVVLAYCCVLCIDWVALALLAYAYAGLHAAI